MSSKGKTGLERVGSTGLGCMLIETQVFKNIEQPWFPITWVKDSRDYKIEDGNFFEKVEAAGIEVWVDHDLSQEVFHVGKYHYGWKDVPENIESFDLTAL